MRVLWHCKVEQIEKHRIHACHITDYWFKQWLLEHKKSTLVTCTTILTLANTYFGQTAHISNVNQSFNISIIKFSAGCRSDGNRCAQGNTKPMGNFRTERRTKKMPPRNY